MDLFTILLLALIAVCVVGLMVVATKKKDLGVSDGNRARHSSRKQLDLYYYQGEDNRILCGVCDGENRADEGYCRICGSQLK